MSYKDVVCSAKNFGFKYSWPEDFSRFACQKENSIIFKIYRLVTFLYFLGWLIYDGIFNSQKQGPKFYIYLTNWSFTILNIQLLFAFVISLIPNRKSDPGGPENPSAGPWASYPPFYVLIYWILHYISAVASISVAILYWTLVFNPNQNSVDVRNLHVHGINAVYHVINILITAIPYRLFHFYIPIIYAAIYLSFTGIYFAAGGENEFGQPFIYSVLNYSTKPGEASAYAIAFALGGIPIVHCGYYLLYKLRLHCCFRCGDQAQVHPDDAVEMDRY